MVVTLHGARLGDAATELRQFHEDDAESGNLLPKTTVDDEAWLKRLQAGDEAAFSDMVRMHHRKMLIVARSMVGEAIAEEVVQEAWVSVFNALPRFERRSSLKTWLMRIVVNEAKMRLRHESRWVHFDDDDSGGFEGFLERFGSDGGWQTPPVVWTAHGPEGTLTRNELADCLDKTLDQLKQNQRMVLELRDVDGLEFSEICNVLNVSESNVRVLLHRARATVFNMIDHFEGTGEC